MNCEKAIELLPWYLNGTLDDGETREVREHLAGCESCRQALEDTRLAWAVFDQHVPSDALVALAWGEEPEGYDPEVLERHLRSCPECAAELELVRTSRRLEEDDRIALFPRAASRPVTPVRRPGAWRAAALAAGLAGVVAASGWMWSAGQARDLERRLAEVRPAPAAPAAPAPVSPQESSAGTADRERLAEMSAQVETLRRQTEEMRDQLTRIADAGPAQVNVAVFDLRPTADVVRGGPGEVAELPAASAAVAILQPSHEETHKDHRIEVVNAADPAGKVVWSAEGLRRSAQGDFPVLLPALKPGSYTVRISALEGGKRVDLESYAVRVK
jgi:hypothetical protein